MRSIGVAIALFALWLLMSGLYDKYLVVGLGAASAILAVYVVRRMDAVDDDPVEINLNPIKFLGYNIWLMGEIAKANWAVTKLILGKERLHQHMFYVPYTQKTDLAQVIFANSITLTPGTITVETEPGRFLVHAVDYSDEDPGAIADMDARVTATEGAS